MTGFEICNFANEEASSAMKEIGFDEPCLGFYGTDELILIDAPVYHNSKTDEEGTTSGLFMTQSAAPLFTQCRKWFREKHDIHIDVNYHRNFRKWCFQVDKFSTGKSVLLMKIYWIPTEHEAYNAAIITACEYIKQNQK